MKFHEVFFRSVIGIGLLFAGADLALPATTRTVTNLNDSGAGSLRQAILDSASGDTINFSVTGTITLTTDELSVNHSLTITGPGAPSDLIITRSSSAANFRIFYFDNGSWTLSNVTVNNGYDGVAGGGIYNGNGNLTLNNCVISGNVATYEGGGIYNKATSSLNNCTITDNQTLVGCSFGNCSGLPFSNQADYGGGGIFNTGTFNITNCTLDTNSAAEGTGVDSFGGESTAKGM